jgi:cytochrome c5
VEQKPISLEEAVAAAKVTKKAPPALEIRVGGETVVEFEQLCDVCHTIVTRYLDNAGKKPKHQSSLREQAEVQVETE